MMCCGFHTTADLIRYCLELREKYNSNIYQLLEDYNIKLFFHPLEETIDGYSALFENEIQIIVINDKYSLNKYSTEVLFIIAHEAGHALFHNDYNVRLFSKLEILKGVKEETQANIFATVFLNIPYNDDVSSNTFQKKVNYIISNYSNLIIDFSNISH